MVALFMVQKMWRKGTKRRISMHRRLDKDMPTMLDITQRLRFNVGTDDLFCLGEDLIEGHGCGVEDNCVGGGLKG
jgi:hypothetical protein